MAPDAATPAGRAPRRKTLEDIRRELDAEFPVSPGVPTVILGAAGSTAKTRVPATSRAGVVVREQRWELGSDGWTLVDDREIERRAR